MRDSSPSLELLNTVTSLIHPDLYKAGRDGLEKLRDAPLTKDYASEWTSVFTGISVISNRRTIAHRDLNGDQAWYDIVASLGSYKRAMLQFPELGLELLYNPGVVVGFCGNVFMHEVEDWEEGDRICYALFMRKAVLDRLKCSAGWMLKGAYDAEKSH
jgi:hypothetical protein